MDVKLGRFGPYIEHNKAFYSLPKEDDPYTIDGPRGVEVIVARRQKIEENTIKTFPEDENVKILKGRWGPFIKVGKQNVRIPKDTDAASLSLDECLQLALQQAPQKPTKAAAKKTTATKTAVKKPAAKKTAAKKTAVKKTAVKKSTTK
jgi:DNA topoisomerase-1